VRPATRISWLAQARPARSPTAFAPPDGFLRPPVEAGSFAEWLRHLPLAPDGTPVRLYDGPREGRPIGGGGGDRHRRRRADLRNAPTPSSGCAPSICSALAPPAILVFDFTSGDHYRFQSYAKV